MSDSRFFIDAKGEIERKEAEKTIKIIQSTHPAYLDELQRKKLAATFEGYEDLFVRASSGIYGLRSRLLTEAARIKREKPSYIVTKPRDQFIDALGPTERKIGEQAIARIQASKKQVRRRDTDVEAAVTFTAAQTLAVAGGAFAGVTAPLRPYNIPRGISQVAATIRSPERFQEAVKRFQADPLKTYIGLPSAYLGGVAAGKVAGFIGEKTRITKGKLTGKFIEETQTRDAGVDWIDQHLQPKGTFKGRTWDPPGAGGYLEPPLLIPSEITRTVFIPKIVYPTFDVAGGVLGITGFIGQSLKETTMMKDVTDVVTPIKFLTKRIPKKAHREIVIGVPGVSFDVKPVLDIIPKTLYKPKTRIRQDMFIPQIPVPVEIAITEPVLVMPTIPAVIQIQTQRQTTKIYPPLIEKPKKKKKPKRKSKALYEFRVDPLKMTFPKIKIPKVPKI